MIWTEINVNQLLIDTAIEHFLVAKTIENT